MLQKHLVGNINISINKRSITQYCFQLLYSLFSYSILVLLWWNILWELKLSVQTSSVIFFCQSSQTHTSFFKFCFGCECLCLVILSFVDFSHVSFGCRNRVLQAKLSKDSIKRTCWTDCSERFSLVSRLPIIHHLSESWSPELNKDLSCLKGCSRWNFSCLWEAGEFSETKTSSLGGINPKLRHPGKESRKKIVPPPPLFFFFFTKEQSPRTTSGSETLTQSQECCQCHHTNWLTTVFSVSSSSACVVLLFMSSLCAGGGWMWRSAKGTWHCGTGRWRRLVADMARPCSPTSASSSGCSSLMSSCSSST